MHTNKAPAGRRRQKGGVGRGAKRGGGREGRGGERAGEGEKRVSVRNLCRPMIKGSGQR